MKTFLSLLLLFFLLGCTHATKSKREFIRAHELYNQALGYNLQNQHEKALPLYDSAILILANEAKFFNNRGLTKFELKDTLGAIIDYQKALQLDNMHYTAYMNLGSIFIEMKNYEEGVYYSELSAKIEPNQGMIFYNIGLGKYGLGDYEGAIESFQKHLNSKYNYSQESAYYYMGCCHEKMNNMALAESCWKKANEIAGYDLKSQLDSIQVPHLPSAKADGN